MKAAHQPRAFAKEGLKIQACSIRAKGLLLVAQAGKLGKKRKGEMKAWEEMKGSKHGSG